MPQPNANDGIRSTLASIRVVAPIVALVAMAIAQAAPAFSQTNPDSRRSDGWLGL